ncbi:hypothetical protein FQA39_LY12949 [Lamprigera yunnana]|nr:hypothetical protein FQA39_LY12949 [Lamprigera yunnana]
MDILFNTSAARNSGFSSVSVAGFNDSSKIILSVLMFIGSAPSSTAGGIRTTTFAILLLATAAVIRNRNHVSVFKKQIPDATVRRSFAVLFLSIILVAFAITAIYMDSYQVLQDSDLPSPTIQLLLLVASAFGTVGFSPYSSQELMAFGVFRGIAMILLDGKKVALQHKQDLINKIEANTLKGMRRPKLVVIMVGDDEASNVYVKHKQKTAKEVGIESTLIRLDQNISKVELFDCIKQLNNDSTVDAILLQLPIPDIFNEEDYLQAIDPKKDVDGFHYINSKSRYNYYWTSNMLVKPLGVMMSNLGATVTLCNENTRDIRSHTIDADIVISATGKKFIITEDMVNNIATVVDIGIIRDLTTNKLVGDVDFEKILNLLAIGGQDERGKNLFALEINEEIFILDAGVKFPDKGILGVDVVIPKLEYLKANADKIKGIFLTNPASYNAGAVGYILKVIDTTIYCNEITQLVTKIKLERLRVRNKENNFVVLKDKQKIKVGNVEIQTFKTTSASPQSLGYVFKTDEGNIVYAGDYIIDGKEESYFSTDFNHINDISKEGVLALIADAEFASRMDFTVPNHKIENFIATPFKEKKTRIAIGILKKISLIYGRTMTEIIKSNMISSNKDLMITDEDLISIEEYMQSNNGVLIISGTADVLYSKLTKIATGNDSVVEFANNDLIILATPPAAGVEKRHAEILDELARTDARLIALTSMLKPKYFIPVKALYKDFLKAEKAAIEAGVLQENIGIIDNGEILKFLKNELQLQTKKLIMEIFSLIGISANDIGSVVLNERKQLATDGVIIIGATIDSRTKEVISLIDTQMRGVIYINEENPIFKIVQKNIENILEAGQETFRTSPETYDINDVKKEIASKVKSLIKQESGKMPIILVMITEVGTSELGVQGSAIATVIARILQTAFIVGLLSVKKFEFIPRFHSFAVPTKLLKKIGTKASPILVNEMLYAVETLLRLSIIMALIFGLALVGLGSVIPSDLKIPNAETNRIASGMLMVYGVGYIEHNMVGQLTTKEQEQSINEYIEQTSMKSEIDRKDESRVKTGVYTGTNAINPITNEVIQI